MNTDTATSGGARAAKVLLKFLGGPKDGAVESWSSENMPFGYIVQGVEQQKQKWRNVYQSQIPWSGQEQITMNFVGFLLEQQEYLKLFNPTN